MIKTSNFKHVISKIPEVWNWSTSHFKFLWININGYHFFQRIYEPYSISTYPGNWGANHPCTQELLKHFRLDNLQAMGI